MLLQAQQASSSVPESGTEVISGLALMGKVSAVLALIIVVVLLFAWLMRRMGHGQQRGLAHLKVVGSVQVGTRERVVVVEVKDTWLVLGVGGQKVSRLHELPAPEKPDSAAGNDSNLPQDFASRFARALTRRNQQ